MKDPIQDTIQRTQRYWYADGLNEIATGLVILLLAFSYWLLQRVDTGSGNGLIVGIVQPIVILGGFLLSNRLVRVFKERITYPRTGYVTYPRPKGKRRWKVALITGATAGILAAIISLTANRLGDEILPVITGAVIAVAIVYFAARIHLIRLYVLAGFTFIAGIGTALSGVQGLNSSAMFFGLMGASWVVSGLWALWNYLRSTQPAKDEETL